MLSTMESNAKGNDNFAIKVISTENVEGKSSIFKKNMEEERIKLIFFHFLSYYLGRLVENLPFL